MEINIIGVGAVGSHIAMFLARLGLPFNCYDFDIVEEHNLNNQIFHDEHVQCLKTNAMKKIVDKINPNITSACTFNFTEVKKESAEKMTGIVFLCVDSIKVRKELLSGLANAEKIIDTRMGKETARIIMIDPNNKKQLSMYRSTLFNPKRTLDEQSCDGEPDCGFIASLLASNALIMMKNIGTEKEINDLNYCIHWFEYIVAKW
jgi:molybdopterin/thiamine biosynthesis adenylyltransferase